MDWKTVMAEAGYSFREVEGGYYMTQSGEVLTEELYPTYSEFEDALREEYSCLAQDADPA